MKTHPGRKNAWTRRVPRLVALLVSLGAGSAPVQESLAQETFWVHPEDTDPRIDRNLDPHFVAPPSGSAPRNALFVFFPGTGGVPAQYQEIVLTAASLGFHSVGLSYVNNDSVNLLCRGTRDPGLFVDVRLEIIDGRNRTDKVDVNRPNSIENRLLRLLRLLDAERPAQRWGQFLSGAGLRWDRSLVSGHSQGAGHAGLLAKIHEVRRAVLFSGSDWFGRRGRPADWIYAPGATPVERTFAFAHAQDPIGAKVFQATWSAWGLDVFGPIRFIEDPPTPENAWSHQLFTDLPPRPDENGELNYHNAPVVDASVPRAADGVTPRFAPVWAYMIAGPTLPPRSR